MVPGCGSARRREVGNLYLSGRDGKQNRGKLTWHHLACCLGLLLQVFSEVIGHEEIMCVPLISKKVLPMRPDRGVKVVLKLGMSVCACSYTLANSQVAQETRKPLESGSTQRH